MLETRDRPADLCAAGACGGVLELRGGEVAARGVPAGARLLQVGVAQAPRGVHGRLPLKLTTGLNLVENGPLQAFLGEGALHPAQGGHLGSGLGHPGLGFLYPHCFGAVGKLQEHVTGFNGIAGPHVDGSHAALGEHTERGAVGRGHSPGHEQRLGEGRAGGHDGFDGRSPQEVRSGDGGEEQREGDECGAKRCAGHGGPSSGRAIWRPGAVHPLGEHCCSECGAARCSQVTRGKTHVR